MKRPTVLLVTQVYIPDFASVGQHLHDLSRELVARGRRVVVLTPSGGYDDPGRKFHFRETIDGVKIVRLPFCTFGKTPIIMRLLGGLSLVIQSMFMGLFVPGLTHILVSTAPPMAPLAALFIGLFRRVRVIYWVMDLNPDQLIAAGRMQESSCFVRLCEFMNRSFLRRSDSIVALDSYMAKRVEKKVLLADRMRIIPPWPYENQFASVKHAANPFRKQRCMDGKFVVMYSGNITPVHPIQTLLDAIKRLKKRKNLVFVFICAESPRNELDEFARANGIHNLVTLPYVPLDLTQYSLSAADLHVVTMGNNMVGVVHPCKVYGIMSVGRPFLVIGPKRSHLGEIYTTDSICWQVDHGDVEGTVHRILEAYALKKRDLRAMGNRARDIAMTRFSRKTLCAEFCKAFE